ncbi:hypothetical protein LIER_34335 [Lithospermum erythrorhizon]|uniref:Uncharacterized protein n=1 Tax=Lithospermum erythrorhizon TaxID=34254 RepID=A0AAV3S2Y6_LITER
MEQTEIEMELELANGIGLDLARGSLADSDQVMSTFEMPTPWYSTKLIFVFITANSHLSKLLYPVGFDFDASGHSGDFPVLDLKLIPFFYLSTSSCLRFPRNSPYLDTWLAFTVTLFCKIVKKLEISFHNTSNLSLNLPFSFLEKFQCLTNTLPVSLNFLNEHGIEDLSHTRCKCSWSGTRRGITIFEKLDRAMRNYEWAFSFPSSTC